MFKKTITYKGFDEEGTEYTEDFYFNLSKAEIAEWRIRAIRDGVDSLEDILDKLKKSKDGNVIMDSFKELLIMSIGRRSPDGKRFMKSKEITDEFMQSEAYSVFFMALVTDANAGAEFANGIVPADLRGKVDAGVSVDVVIPQTTQQNVPTPVLPQNPQPNKLTAGDFLTMSPEQFRDWQQRNNSSSPLGL